MGGHGTDSSDSRYRQLARVNSIKNPPFPLNAEKPLVAKTLLASKENSVPWSSTYSCKHAAPLPPYIDTRTAYLIKIFVLREICGKLNLQV
jgi:hypothetical protein